MFSARGTHREREYATEGVVQMLGGRSSGGTSVLVSCRDGTGMCLLVANALRRCLSDRGAAICWKHLAKHMLISWQCFCGQSGQGLDGFAGLWHGIASAWASIACEPMPIASATELDTGTLSTTPSMASMLSKMKRRCQWRLIKAKESWFERLESITAGVSGQ